MTSNTRTQRGFTLIELMITISIMGVLSAVVVLGVGDFGTASGCSADAKMVRNAESSFFTTNARYATQAELVSAALLKAPSILHDVQVSGLSYTMTELGKCQNQGTADAGVVPVVATTRRPGFTVMVAASDGSPVANAVIQYRQGSGAWTAMGTTGASGLVTAPLASGSYDIQATLLGTTNSVLGVSVTSGTLVVLPTVALTARVRDSQNLGLSGAAVQLRQNGSSTWLNVGTTGSSGDVVTQVLPSNYDVNATWASVTATRSSIAVNQSTIVLFQSTTLSTHVTTATGSAVSGATVTITPSGGSAYPSLTTDANGWAVREVLSGTFDDTVSFRPAGATASSTATVRATPVATTPVVVEMQVQ